MTSHWFQNPRWAGYLRSDKEQDIIPWDYFTVVDTVQYSVVDGFRILKRQKKSQYSSKMATNENAKRVQCESLTVSQWGTVFLWLAGRKHSSKHSPGPLLYSCLLLHNQPLHSNTINTNDVNETVFLTSLSPYRRVDLFLRWRHFRWFWIVIILFFCQTAIISVVSLYCI